MGKKVTTEQFIEKAVKVHGSKYDYSKTEYINSLTKVIITCPEHGDFEQTPASHCQGFGCPDCANKFRAEQKRWTLERFIKEAIKVHRNLYDYSKVEYKTNKTKVTITCPIHGDFEQLPYMHLRGSGCKQCAYDKLPQNNIKPVSDFINQSNIVHNMYYDYSKTDYTGALNKVIIICPTHGEFKQRPSDHLAGMGCPDCAKAKLGWTYTNWEDRALKSVNFESFKLYIIECWNDDERFIKIGKTFTSLGKRFNGKSCIPYEWKVLSIEEGSARYVSEKELELHSKFKQEQYVPKLEFSGSGECFNLTVTK